MAVKLHRCSATWAKMSGHPCWRVQSALDEMGVEYEIVKEPLLRGRRKAVIEAHRPEGPACDRARGRHLVPRGIRRDGACDPVRGASARPHERRYTFPLAGL